MGAPSNCSKELKAALQAAKAAGVLLRERYRRGVGKPRVKLDGTLQTDADLAAEKRIKATLKRFFPRHAFLGEETTPLGPRRSYREKIRRRLASGPVWVVDPLDGTTNFAIRHPFFAVSIALLSDGEPRLGVVHSPLTGEFFYAERGAGAFLNGEPIRVSRARRARDAVLTFCHGHTPRALEAIARVFPAVKAVNDKFRQMGSASLELCYVACGRTGAFLMVDVTPWDVAAGALLVGEAGGAVTDLRGEAFTLASTDLLASNGRLHGRLLALLESLGCSGR